MNVAEKSSPLFRFLLGDGDKLGTLEELGYVCTYIQWISSRVPSDFGGLFELGPPAYGSVRLL